MTLSEDAQRFQEALRVLFDEVARALGAVWIVRWLNKK